MKRKQRLSKVWYRASKSHHVGALAFLVDSAISMLWYWQITLARPESKAISETGRFVWEHGRAYRLHMRLGIYKGRPNTNSPAQIRYPYPPDIAEQE